MPKLRLSKPKYSSVRLAIEKVDYTENHYPCGFCGRAPKTVRMYRISETGELVCEKCVEENQ